VDPSLPNHQVLLKVPLRKRRESLVNCIGVTCMVLRQRGDFMSSMLKYTADIDSIVRGNDWASL